MKKFIFPLLIVFFFTTAINKLQAQCWSETTVTWDGECVYPDDKTVYVVRLQIRDECTLFQTIFDEYDIVSTTTTNYTFCIQNSLCSLDEKDPCFKVIFSVYKVDIDTQLPVCGKQLISYKNCEGLINDLGNPILILEN